ncbi:MAG: DUF503 domain-containing protein [Anaerolineae bacterium]|nr:MAG: DUF503 domain-containing protein [Anaerolineae bacterium]
MVIGLCTIELHLPGAHSLKDKRSVLKSAIRRIRNEFNVAIAEVDDQDFWRSAVLGVVTVSNDAAYVHGLLTQVVNWIERTRLDVDLVDYQIEML